MSFLMCSYRGDWDPTGQHVPNPADPFQGRIPLIEACRMLWEAGRTRVVGGEMDQPTQHAYRDPSSLARWLRVGLIAFLALSVVQLAQGLSLFLFLASVKSGGFHSRDALVSMAHAVDFRTLILARVTLALLLSNAVLYFVWLYRSNTNARALVAPG